MSQLKTTVTPVLSSSVGYLEDVRDQIATMLRFVIMNPGWTSSIWESNMISFRKLSSTYEHDKETLVGQLQMAFGAALNRMFPDYITECDFKAKDINEDQEDGKYAVQFSVFIAQRTDEQSSKEPAFVSGMFTVDTITNDISISYDNTLDNKVLNLKA